MDAGAMPSITPRRSGVSVLATGIIVEDQTAKSSGV
jgi:hypothetical protein